MLVLRDDVLPLLDGAERARRPPAEGAEHAVIVRGQRPAPGARRRRGSSASASWSPARSRPSVAEQRRRLRRRRALRRRHRPDRRLRRASTPPARVTRPASPPDPAPERTPSHDRSTQTSSSTRCASWPTSAPAPPAPRCRQLLGRSVDISVPNAVVLPLAEAVEAVGPAEQEVTGVVIPLVGDIDAVVLLLFPVDDARHAVRAARRRGRHRGRRSPRSARSATSSAPPTSTSLGAMTGLELEPHAAADGDGHARRRSSPRSSPPARPATDTALILDSELRVEGEECSLSFLLLPSPAACASCSRAWASRHDAGRRDRGAHGRARGVVGARRGPGVHRAGLVHRPRAGRPRARHRRARARDAARGDRRRRPGRQVRRPRGPGARRPHERARDVAHRACEAVLVGGAQMFTFGGGGAGSALDIGVRNEAAVRAALATARIPVRRRRPPAGTAGARCASSPAARYSARGRRCRSRAHARSSRMSQSLTPEQIAALVEAAKQGDLPGRRARRRPAALAAPAHDGLRAADEVHERSGAADRAARSRASAAPRRRACRPSCASRSSSRSSPSTQLTWSDAQSQLPSNSVCAVIDIDPIDTQMLLSAELSFVLCALERSSAPLRITRRRTAA